MDDIEFASFLVSRVCHDLVGPMGAVVNGLEVLEDERDAAMRADALKIVSSSAEQALARLQFLRIAFGAAGSAGAELDLNEVGRLVKGLIGDGKVKLDWQAAHVNWPKDWAKLLMNATMLGADCLPRGGEVRVVTSPAGEAPSFHIYAAGPNARILDDAKRAVQGEADRSPIDARGIQPYLTYKLAHALSVGVKLVASDGKIELSAG
jgi:histidine phosphotransferase ChpT